MQATHRQTRFAAALAGAVVLAATGAQAETVETRLGKISVESG